jgi:hypothetical protein
LSGTSAILRDDRKGYWPSQRIVAVDNCRPRIGMPAALSSPASRGIQFRLSPHVGPSNDRYAAAVRVDRSAAMLNFGVCVALLHGAEVGRTHSYHQGNPLPGHEKDRLALSPVLWYCHLQPPRGNALK